MKTICTVLGLLASLSLAPAATIPVTTQVDESAANAACSLREAIEAANTDAAVNGCPAGSGADVVQVPAGTYVLSQQTDADVSSDLDVTTPMTIAGAGRDLTIIDGGDVDKVFDVRAGDAMVVVIRGLTVRRGNSPNGGGGVTTRNGPGGAIELVDCTVSGNRAKNGGGGITNGGGITMQLSGCTVEQNTVENRDAKGGGINNAGMLLLEGSTVRANTAPGDAAQGGGIANTSVLTLLDSVVSDNTALGAGGTGGGIASGGSLTVDRSTVSGNRARGNGGGIASSQTFTLVNATLSGNQGSDGGGLYTDSSLPNRLFFNVTVTKNTATNRGGGVFNEDAAGMNLVNTIVADNTGASNTRDCGGVFVSGGHNLIGNRGTCAVTAGAGDRVGVDARLNPLSNNGGPTPTHAPLSGSPAIDGGDPLGCPDANGDPLTTDQRGFARPERPGGVCDVGAVEVGSVAPPTTTSTSTSSTTIPGGGTTTTTVGGGGPTTSTTVPPAGPPPTAPSETPCDDGDACTAGDRAAGGACSGTPVTGTAALTCAYRGVGLAVPACTGQKVPKGLTNAFKAAGKLADQAAVQSGAKARSRAKKAVASLKKAEKLAQKAKVLDACKTALLARVRAARSGADGFLAGG